MNLKDLDWGKSYSPIRSAEGDSEDIILPEDEAVEEGVGEIDNGFELTGELPDEEETVESEFDPSALIGSFACHCPSCQGDYLRVGGTPVNSKFPGHCPLCEADVEQVVAGIVAPLENAEEEEEEEIDLDVVDIASSRKQINSSDGELEQQVIDELEDYGYNVEYVDIDPADLGLVPVLIGYRGKEYVFSVNSNPRTMVNDIVDEFESRVRS